MSDDQNVIYLTDYLENNNRIKTINHIDGNFSALVPGTHLMKRIGALAIDFTFILGLFFSIYFAYQAFVSEYLGPLTYRSQIKLINGNPFILLGIFLLIYTSYFFYTTYVLHGRTLGKLAFKLRVIQEEFVHNSSTMDYELNLSDCFKRSLGYLGCYLSFCVFFIFNFISEDKRGLPDYLSGSRTVTDKWLNQMLEHKKSQQEQVIINIAELDKKQAA